MIRPLLHYSFVLPTLAFLAHQVAFFYFNISIPFLDNYLDPFCFSAIMLHCYKLQRHWVGLHRAVSKEEVFAFVFVLSLFSELLFPFLSVKFTADVFDVLGITLGGVWFYFTSAKKDGKVKGT